MRKDSILLTRDGDTKPFRPHVAKYAKELGWIEYTAPPEQVPESLTDLKQRIKSLKTIEEVNQELFNEQSREIPRKAVIDLCNQIISEWI